MKLTIKLKLKPTEAQEKLLLDTIQQANTACNRISGMAWESKTFSQFKLHKQVYYAVKESFKLSSQMIVRCISKVCDSYKLDKKTKRTYKPLGSIAYDSRILSYNIVKQVASIWTLTGREKIEFACHHPAYLNYIQGEADLAYIKGKFYLLQTIDIPSEKEEWVSEFIGADMGITDICTLSTGKTFASKKLNHYKVKRQKVRSSLQSKGTKGCKKVLKRLSGKEKRTQTILNHTIAKQVVTLAKEQGKGIVVEELKGIRKSLDKFSKKQKGLYNRWAFYDLRCKIEYKAQMVGIPVIVVDPRYSSQMCNACKHMGNRKSKSFKCINCGLETDADVNAAQNLAIMGSIVNTPENSTRLSCELGLNSLVGFSRI
jgi:putative transposase